MKIAIAGYGLEGEQSYRYWTERGEDVTILDEKPTLSSTPPIGANVVLGPDALKDLSAYDMVVRTASMPPSKLVGANKIWSATNEFFLQCPAPIIGVTGTKGKGTTSSLIASILRAAGKTVHLVGNIGVPALEVLSNISPDDVVVYEMSSFQLWDLEKSPHVAVVLMIEPDHLDVHSSFEEYITAKANIVIHQSLNDRVVFCRDNHYSLAIAQNSEASEFIPYQDNEYAHVSKGAFYYGEKFLCLTSALQLPGAHNLDNACAAIDAVWNIANGDIVSIEQGLESFRGLPHRLKFVAEVDGIKFYDDSIATTPGSAIAALRSFDDLKVIILGGSDKGADYGLIVDECAEQKAKIIAIGQTGERIYNLALEKGVEVVRVEGLMHEVVQMAREIASSGSVVILSPASASFDQYQNYADRGDKFVEAVGQLCSH